MKINTVKGSKEAYDELEKFNMRNKLKKPSKKECNHKFIGLCSYNYPEVKEHYDRFTCLKCGLIKTDPSDPEYGGKPKESPEWDFPWAKYFDKWVAQGGRNEDMRYGVANFMTGQGAIMLKDFLSQQKKDIIKEVEKYKCGEHKKLLTKLKG